MRTYRKFIALYISAIIIFMSLGGASASAAAVSVPKVKFHTQPKTAYKVGDAVSFKVYSPGFNGRVQYRVVLYNNTTKKTQDLWTAGDRYNKNLKPYGKDAQVLQWKMSQPGSYKIMVYTKRAGLPSSKTLFSKGNYDSYVASASFTVTAKTSAAVSAPTAKVYSQPQAAYKLGDTVSFKVHAPNYQGKVQYRVVLYNTLTKKTQDLWTAGDRYNKSLKPLGKDIHNIQWKISQPGNYKLIVYVKRADLPSSKTVFKAANYDSLVSTTIFSVSKTAKPITLDTTKQEVINILGEPIEAWAEDNTYFMIYKYGEIYLSNLSGEWRVIGWLDGGIPNIALGTKNPSAPAFKIGSSMEDVARVMGTPKFIPPYYLNENDDYWMYPDESVVFFDKNEKVVSYINKGSLKVFMGDKDPLAPPITYTSKIADVLKAMGTPDTVNAFFIESADYSRTSVSVTEYPNPYTGNKYFVEFNSDYTYYQYKDSFVAFDENEKVIYFINKGNLNLDFGKKDPNFTGLKIDSTEGDIVKAMGTPDKILDNSEFKRNWIYGDSYIMVDDNGKIVGWLNNGNLNISKNDSKPGAPVISLGSTKADVLNAMGTPTKFSFDYWEYGEAQILFNDKGQVERIYKTKDVKLSNSQKDDTSKGFTIGSSVDDVMKAMGTPDMVSKGGYNNTYVAWAYGLARPDVLPQASVYFSAEGKVVYWEDMYEDSIKFKLAPYPEVNPSAPPLTIGSTKDEVLKAMGTPTSLYAPDVKQGSWYYDKSVITFDQNEKVVGIANNSKNIKFTLGNKVEGAKFSFASTKDEVIKAMGTPNSISIDPTHDLVHWQYDTAWIGIDNTTGRVNSWRNPYGLNLNKITPDPNTKFKVGSSADDVLRAMGLPYTINIEGKPFVFGHDGPYETYSVWNYGNSRIDFNKDGKVIRWNNNDGNLKTE